MGFHEHLRRQRAPTRRFCLKGWVAQERYAHGGRTRAVRATVLHMLASNRRSVNGLL